jgi:beta-galactosidase beta subunit
MTAMLYFVVGHLANRRIDPLKTARNPKINLLKITNMIIGELNEQCCTLRILAQQRPIWKICFNWLRSISDDMACGKYNIDYEIVTAFCCEIKNSNQENWILKSSESTVQIYYTISGVVQIGLNYPRATSMQDMTLNKNPAITENQNATPFTLSQNQFAVLFPGESHLFGHNVHGVKASKAVIISAPTQRFF